MKARHVTTILTSACVLVLLASSMATIGTAVAQSATNPPTMTDELMERLIKYTRAVKETGSLAARVCKVLDLCDGSKNMPLKFCISDGKHYFGLRPEADSKDILILVERGTTLEVYLTDKTGTLRAAAILENGKAHLVTNENAAKKFEAELALFAKEAAAQLPPSDTVGAGDKK